MSNTRHTPGPWHVDGHNLKAVIAKSEHSRWATICICGFGTTYTPDTAKLYEDKANAKLIAAAPELLEALINCVNALRNGDPNEPTTFIAWTKTISSAEAIIKKATE